jgi:hypothetical protein
MAAGLAGHAVVWRIVMALVLGLGGGSLAFAHGPHRTCFSGYEIFPGSDAGGGVTQDVTFVGIDSRANADGGIDQAACDRWTTNSKGGTWSAKIDRVGNAGIGSGTGVSVVGGRWLWVDGADRFHAGSVVQGYVMWPDTIEQDKFGCGAGVAKFYVTLSVWWPPGTGTFDGCLDDTHLDPTRQPFVFPPPIWGTLNIN